MTKKDNVVALRNGPPEDAVTALNLSKLKRADETLQTAKNDHQSVIKHVEGKGINLKAAGWAIRIQKSGKLDEAVAELKARLEYLYILGTPVTKAQADLFRLETPRTPGVDKAREQGRYHGIMGNGTSENPYALDSAQGQSWMTGFHGGTEERALVLALEDTENELVKGDDPDDSDADETTIISP